MALNDADLFVVQQGSGNEEIRKLTFEDLKTALGNTGAVVYKDTLDMTDSGTQPSDSNVAGNLYIQSDATGTFAWNPQPDPAVTVVPGTRALYNGTKWTFSDPVAGDIGVEKVTGSQPISITGTAAEPNVTIADSAEGIKGAVALASDAQVASGDPNVAATAAQLATTNAAISEAGGGTVTNVTGSAPIQVDNNTSTPNITIDAATAAVPGAIKYVGSGGGVVVNNDSAATPDYIAESYLTNNFSTLDAV